MNRLSSPKKALRIAVMIITAVFLLSLTVSAVSVDGSIGYSEWSGSSFHILIPVGSPCNNRLHYAGLRILRAEKESAIYLGFQVSQKTSTPFNDSVLTGVKLQIKNGRTILCLADGSAEYSNAEYAVISKFIYGTNNDVSAEIRIGYKFGLPESGRELLGLQILDGTGEPSDFLTWPIEPATTTSAAATTTKPATTAKPVTTIKPTVASTHPTTSTKSATTAKTTTATSKSKDSTSASPPADTSAFNGPATESPGPVSDYSTPSTSPREDDSRGITRNNTHTASGFESEATDEPISAISSSSSGKTRQYLAIGAAVLLLAGAGALVILAGLPKKPKGTPSAGSSDAKE